MLDSFYYKMLGLAGQLTIKRRISGMDLVSLSIQAHIPRVIVEDTVEPVKDHQV
jgi:hypothetical protein